MALWHWAAAALIFLLALAVLVRARPALVFRPDGTPRPFGVGGGSARAADDEPTIYSLGALTVVLAVTSYYTVLLVDLLAP
jgi:hypothetical protein